MFVKVKYGLVQASQQFYTFSNRFTVYIIHLLFTLTITHVFVQKIYLQSPFTIHYKLLKYSNKLQYFFEIFVCFPLNFLLMIVS